jgi:PAS domain S-box-containing protein
VCFRDATRQKRADLALRDSEERFLATCERLQVGIAHLDPVGRWLYANQRMCDIVGYTHDELFARTFDDVAGLGAPRVDLRKLERSLRGDKPGYEVDVRCVRSNGDQVWCHLSLSLVRGPDNAPKYFVLIIEDVSNRTAAGAALDSVAHELRLPLSHIKGFVSSLCRTDMEWGPLTRRDFLAEIDHEADRLAHLIEELLEPGHATGNALTRRRRPSVTPRALVLASLDRVRAELGSRAVQIDVPPTLHSLQVDAPAMERVLANLLQNASKYSPPNSPIGVSASVVGDALELRVDDRGPGIPEEDYERVFEPYYRRRQSMTTRPGTGLGLAICRSIVTDQGGRIWTGGRPGGGARFTIELPVESRPGRGPYAARQPSTGVLARHRHVARPVQTVGAA